MKRIAASTICLLLVFCSLVAQQEETKWEHIATDKDFMYYYIDRESIVSNQSGTRQTWIKGELLKIDYSIVNDILNKDLKPIKKSKRINKKAKAKENLNTIKPKPILEQTMTLYECDCSNKQIRALKTIEYFSNKKAYSSIEKERWDYVVPETIGETIFINVCKK